MNEQMTMPVMARSEPSLALPTRRLLAAALVAGIVTGAGWALVAWALGHRGNAILAGPCAALIVAAAMAAGLLAVGPWKRRPIGLWVSFWMAATVLRLLLTAAGAYLLYSATSFGPIMLATAVVSAYLMALLAEVLVLTQFLRHSLSV